ncbi:MAG: hypothetical protein AABX51_00355 [Nanoarchaeota archaeon]
MRKHRHHKAQVNLRKSLNHENIELKIFYGLIMLVLIVIAFFIITTFFQPKKSVSGNAVLQQIAKGE